MEEMIFTPFNVAYPNFDDVVVLRYLNTEAHPVLVDYTYVVAVVVNTRRIKAETSVVQLKEEWCMREPKTNARMFFISGKGIIDPRFIDGWCLIKRNSGELKTAE